MKALMSAATRVLPRNGVVRRAARSVLSQPSIVEARYRRVVRARMAGDAPIRCVICGEEGRFRAFGHPPRYNARCPNCGSLERHRLYKHLIDLGEIDMVGKRVLHFAPEAALRPIFSEAAGDYVGAELRPMPGDREENIEQMSFGAGSFDAAVCNHVLEHVHEAKTLGEFRRVLTAKGVLYLTVPECAGLPETYEDPTIDTPDGRTAHFGQQDHIRLYGADLERRVAAAGFAVRRLGVGAAEAIRLGLVQGETILECRPITRHG